MLSLLNSFTAKEGISMLILMWIPWCQWNRYASSLQLLCSFSFSWLTLLNSVIKSDILASEDNSKTNYYWWMNLLAEEQKLKVKLESIREEIKVKVRINESVQMSIFMQKYFSFNLSQVIRFLSESIKVHGFTLFFFGMLLKQN